MFSRSLLTPMLLAAALLPLGSLRGAQPRGGLEPQDGLLLLRNGYVLQGRVSLLGPRYLVVTKTGEIQVPLERVETFCLNLEEAYRFKRAAIDPGSAEDRRELAAWCLQHQLTRQAGSELSAADQLRPNHPTTRRLQQRLQMALRPPPAPAATPKPDPSRPSPSKLAQFIKNLPPGTLESFTQHIQPLLINRCISCHGRPGAGTFVLRRLARGRPTDHRLTQANLFSTLQYVDREKPESSKLLVLVIKPHGGSQEAALADRKQLQFRLLAGWVYGVARATASRSDVPKAVVSKPETLSQASRPLLQVMDRPEDVPAKKTSTPFKEMPAQQRLQHGVAGRFVPRDPFDPEIFNRRYFSGSAQEPRRRAELGRSAHGDRRIEFGVGRRPSSRPSRPLRPAQSQRPDTVPGRQDR